MCRDKRLYRWQKNQTELMEMKNIIELNFKKWIHWTEKLKSRHKRHSGYKTIYLKKWSRLQNKEKMRWKFGS